jgi:septum formation protein
MADLLLASASPRRRELLEQIGVNFISEAQDIDESVRASETPSQYVERLAREKAEQGCKALNMTALGSDTCVVLDGEILSKPISVEDAKAMLNRLSGRSHQVLTGVAICKNEGHELTLSSQVVSTDVSFIPLTSAQIERYVATGESMDKAGSYGIQGKAAVFVSAIVGSYSNVVGLPLMETAQLLQQHNIPVWCAQ